MKQLLYWIVPMFSYGALREYKSPYYKKVFPGYSTNEPQQNQLNINMFMNGIYYASPCGLYKLYHLYKRMDAYKNKVHVKSDIYTEWSYNVNRNVLF